MNIRGSGPLVVVSILGMVTGLSLASFLFMSSIQQKASNREKLELLGNRANHVVVEAL